jgi:putative CocE/NonD family hydrolase
MRKGIVALALALGLACAAGVAAQPADTLKSDIAPGYRPASAEADYTRREAMIPMRDGVKLYAVILMKKGAAHAPILLERTPYGADGNIAPSSQTLARIVSPADAPYLEDGYIRVWQDIRGRGRSEGVYVTNRPLSGPLNPTGVDHATDAYDTIDWLVKNLPESNGRVGVIGGSYAGFTTLMATLSGHPALKAAVPINPMVDVWTGDDWYHNGAFRQITLNVLPIIMAGQGRAAPPPTGMVDLYGLMLETGSAGDYMRRFGLDGFPAAARFVEHEGFDAWWREQALDRLLAARPIRVPMLLVGGLYDEQDLYGAPAVFRALHPLDKAGKVSLLLGPWSHMGVNGDGARLGPVTFPEDTAATARRDVIKPFLDARLKDGAAPFDPPAVISYATGEDRWRRSQAVPPAATPLYLRAAGRLSFDAPPSGEAAKDDYVSDPAKPVPVIARPFYFSGRSDSWKTSLIADQRFASQRPDVLTFVTEPLATPVHIFGQPQVELFAATSGTDSDFVVKLIDVSPAEMADPDMGGYQRPVGMEIFRGRYLKALDKASPLTPGQAEAYRFALPMADHVFAKGHRIMVQVQSSWFPVYDRNPQTFVPSIFEARPQDYRKATQSVFHMPGQASAVRLPILRD